MTGELLNKDQINCIANDYNDLWRARAITDKDNGQVEDLIVSHLALLEEVKRLQGIEEKYESLKKNVGKPTVVHYEHRVRAEKERDIYRKALSKIVCCNIPIPDEIWETANNALEGAATNG